MGNPHPHKGGKTDGSRLKDIVLRHSEELILQLVRVRVPLGEDHGKFRAQQFREAMTAACKEAIEYAGIPQTGHQEGQEQEEIRA